MDPSDNTTVDVGSGTATIGLPSLETVTCTFTNTQDLGSLKVMKEFNALTSGFDGTFDLLVDCSVDSFDQTVTLAAGGEETISGIPPGRPVGLGGDVADGPGWVDLLDPGGGPCGGS